MPEHLNLEEARRHARALARAGVKAFCLALNHERDPMLEWVYSEEVQQRVLELTAELDELLRHGQMLPNPGHAQWARAEAARKDPALQKLISRASRKTPIRR